MKKINLLLGLVVALAGIIVSAAPVQAGLLQNVIVTPNDSRPSRDDVNHQFQFTVSTAGIGKVKFEYCQDPSGTCSAPAAFSQSATAIQARSGFNATWTVSSSSTNIIRLGYDDTYPGTQDLTGSENVSVTFSGLTNHAIGDCNAQGSSTDTCYVKITTYEHPTVETTSTQADIGTGSISVINPVTVTARVDPTFSFTVTGVASGTSVGSVVNGGTQPTTSATSTYNTLPFGNLTAGTPRYLAHTLTVSTNTESGWTVTSKMITAMTGVYGNDVDPFTNDSAADNDPKPWASPSGTTPNTNTAWVGYNTNDQQITGWNSVGISFGPADSSANTVSYRTDSAETDTVTVTYAIEANTYQPADSYTGTLLYNALPTY